VLKLLLFVLPLCLDTFAVASALGTAGLPRRERLRVSLAMSGFEMAMPIAGLAIGRGLGSAIGTVADDVAGAFLVALGLYLLFGEADEEGELVALATRRGLAFLALGVAVSLDELAMGFTIGLLGLSIWLAVVLIGVQAFAVAQFGLRLGSRVAEGLREWAERLAGALLVALGLLVLLERVLA
jgi:putative Mn2+ efflux pump MntP